MLHFKYRTHNKKKRIDDVRGIIDLMDQEGIKQNSGTIEGKTNIVSITYWGELCSFRTHRSCLNIVFIKRNDCRCNHNFRRFSSDNHQL